MLRLFSFLLPLLALLTPVGASADLLNPARGTAWDLYVFGNAYVVEQVLTGVKLLMTSDSSGFSTLLIFMATLGFLVLAIGAGFDPSKNLIKMFTYIIVAWGVSYGSTQLTANVVVQDRVDFGSEFYVAGVPALVALPAVVTSQIGLTFTEFIETYFTPVGDEILNVSAGQFNLFNRMLEESSQFTWRSPELKKSLSAYVSNCVVPAIAQGRLSVQDLKTTTNMVAEFNKARHVSILTQYYAPEGRTSLPNVPELTPAADQAARDQQLASARGAGLMLSCDSAMTALTEDMTAGAAAMLKAGNEAWRKAGVFTPFESAYATLLARASAQGGGASAGFGSPAGFIMQQAMLNSSSGAFRQAAVQTGNNELVQAAALAQAEQQQKSSWVAGFAVFNNMMGYVFVMLQTLIFAMTPLIIIALLVPGLGSKIFANYAQVLIWLTLWHPMLAIVNFILLMFGSSAFAESIGMAGGLSASNKYIISERANDLVIAGQFLGTMVPLLTWGIVKGAMAFTEFITAGVGSQFATQAGAAAASGNLSMNNLSMNNTSLDKFSTQMSSAVGFQSVGVSTNAGAVNVRQSQGGTVTDRSEAVANDAVRLERAAKAEQSMSTSVAQAIATSVGKETTLSGLVSTATSQTASVAEREAATRALAQVAATARGVSVSETLSDTRAFVEQQTGSATDANTRSAEAGGHVGGIFAKALGIKVGGSLNSSVSNQQQVGATTSEGSQRASGVDTRASSSSGMQSTLQNSSSTERGTVYDASSGQRIDESAAVKRALSETLSQSLSRAESMGRVASEASGLSLTSETDMARLAVLEQQYRALTAGIPSASVLAAGREELAANLARQGARFGADADNLLNGVREQVAGNQGLANQRVPTLVSPSAFNQEMANIQGQAAQQGAALTTQLEDGQTNAAAAAHALGSPAMRAAGAINAGNVARGELPDAAPPPRGAGGSR